MAWFDYSGSAFGASELLLVRSTDERIAISIAAYHRARTVWRSALDFALCVAAFSGFVMFAPKLLHSILPPLAAQITFAIAFIVLGVAAVLVSSVPNRAYRRAVRTILNERGYPVCMACGYNLAALVSHRCPECGRPF